MYFVIRQSVWLLMGFVACWVLAKTDYHKMVRFAPWMIGLSAVLILACFVPGLGKKLNGAHRWLSLGPINIQPSEIVKLAVVVFCAWWLGEKQDQVHEFKMGVAVPAGVVLFMCGMLTLQKDLGTCMIIVIISFLMMFAAGSRLIYLIPVPILGISGILGIALMWPERLQRLLAFLHPELYKDGKGYQIWQALVAFGSGGTSGLGLGNSVQKMSYLPEAPTDMIFAIVGEELGLWCTLLVVLLFLTVALSGGCIAVHAPDSTGSLLGLGAVALICLQAGMNMAVVTAMVPAKGLGLPFISYGGSNLLICFACLGILLNIHRQAEYDIESGRTSHSLAGV